MISHFEANGKLMISGEYLVLKGATALVLPLKIGQQMSVSASGSGQQATIEWKSTIRDVPWFAARVETNTWTLGECTSPETANRLVLLLNAIEEIQPAFFYQYGHYEVTTNTDFPINWGFGSSSALVANLSKWTGVDPFELHFLTSEGSGADVAAAVSPGPILYRLQNTHPAVTPVEFKPPFHQHIWFVNLGIKQDSANSIRSFNTINHASNSDMDIIDSLTHELLQAGEITTFMRVIAEHEKVMAGVLHKTRIKEERFADFQGEVKSLGAWGGDFIMAVSPVEGHEIQSYFRSKGLDIIFPFDEIIR